MKEIEKTAVAALSLLDRADELRAEARAMLDPIDKVRGWRGAGDALSSLMNFDLPRKTDLPALKALRKERLLRVAREVDAAGVTLELVPTHKSRSR